jgi:hypothetical protein
VEYDAVKRLNAGIETCVKAADTARVSCLKRFWLTKKSTLTGWKDSCRPSMKWASRITWRSSCTRGKNRVKADPTVAGSVFGT